MASVSGILFDKDGTLFDFHATWSAWAARLMRELAKGDDSHAARLGASVGYDLATGRFARDSVVIAGTPAEIAAELLPQLPGQTLAALVARMNELAAAAPMAEAVPLQPLLQGLRRRGLRLGVATNDSEGPAKAHLGAVGVLSCFDFVAGSDSGFGGKPAPGMLLAFAARLGIAPGAVAMVGDSRHDLLAGRAAGMRTVAVLTGPAAEAELAPLADVVLPDIGHLPAWLDRAAVARNSA
ncbi:HAD family hydrolase [Plastorhodobacter daqingensis]|uniref:phosphoglycolate phosphatase n=1 Tax=Plastorhodobacter daqingensis TaxID=1387281 RepID=A0ABW2UGC8_9RHOB